MNNSCFDEVDKGCEYDGKYAGAAGAAGSACAGAGAGACAGAAAGADSLISQRNKNAKYCTSYDSLRNDYENDGRRSFYLQ